MAQLGAWRFHHQWQSSCRSWGKSSKPISTITSWAQGDAPGYHRRKIQTKEKHCWHLPFHTGLIQRFQKSGFNLTYPYCCDYFYKIILVDFSCFCLVLTWKKFFYISAIIFSMPFSAPLYVENGSFSILIVYLHVICRLQLLFVLFTNKQKN